MAENYMPATSVAMHVIQPGTLASSMKNTSYDEIAVQWIAIRMQSNVSKLIVELAQGTIDSGSILDI